MLGDHPVHPLLADLLAAVCHGGLLRILLATLLTSNDPDAAAVRSWRCLRQRATRK